MNHLNYYNDRTLRRLKDLPVEPPSSNESTFGEPGDPADAAGWEATVTRTKRIAADLREALAGLREGDPPPSAALTVEGLPHWVLHDVYHTGQIVLIRRQQGPWGG